MQAARALHVNRSTNKDVDINVVPAAAELNDIALCPVAVGDGCRGNKETGGGASQDNH